MSSIPGYTLEDYVSDHWSLSEETETFARVLALHEPYRESVELKLLDFDEEEHSWRQYASYAFEWMHEAVDDAVLAILNEVKP